MDNNIDILEEWKRLEIESYGERITNIENTLNSILELLQQKSQ